MEFPVAVKMSFFLLLATSSVLVYFRSRMTLEYVLLYRRLILYTGVELDADGATLSERR